MRQKKGRKQGNKKDLSNRRGEGRETSLDRLENSLKSKIRKKKKGEPRKKKKGVLRGEYPPIIRQLRKRTNLELWGNQKQSYKTRRKIIRSRGKCREKEFRNKEVQSTHSTSMKKGWLGTFIQA